MSTFTLPPGIAPSDLRPPPPPEESTRDWAGLPHDVLLAVLAKLGAVEILSRAELVCGSWLLFARREPALWRHVDMTREADLLDQDKAEAMARVAVDRSQGQLQYFAANRFATEELLHYIADRTSSLKGLHLSLCYKITNEGLAEAMKKFPQLEELELSFCSFEGKVFESIGQACPQLKHFRLSRRIGGIQFLGFDEEMDTEALAVAQTMHELRDLQLFGNDLTNRGLMAILDNCLHLKSLDIRRCFNVAVDASLEAKYARIKDLKLPKDSTDDKYRVYADGNSYHSAIAYNFADGNSYHSAFAYDFDDLMDYADIDDVGFAGYDMNDVY